MHHEKCKQIEYLCRTSRQKRLLHIKIPYTWSGDKGANKRRLLEAQRMRPTRARNWRSNLWRVRQNVPQTDPRNRRKLWKRAHVSSLSSLHDQSSCCKPSQERGDQSRNPFKTTSRKSGTSDGRQMRPLLRVLEQTPERDAGARTLLNMRKNGRLPLRLAKFSKASRAYQKQKNRSIQSNPFDSCLIIFWESGKKIFFFWKKQQLSLL